MNSGFHIYILGVPSRYRGATLEKQLLNFGLSFTRIDGVEPNQLETFKVRALAITPYLSIIPPLVPGEVCCSFGHKLIYSKILEGDSEWSLILEDDVSLRIDPRLISLEHLDASMPTILQISPDPTEQLFSSNDSLEDFPPDAFILPLKNPQLETSAYFINKAAAHKILELVPMNFVTSKADWPIESLGRVNFMKTRGFCALQFRVDSGSQIEGREVAFFKIPTFFRGIRFFFRMFGVTSLVYRSKGVPFISSYRAEVLIPLQRKINSRSQ